MKYSEFLSKSRESSNSLGIVLRDESESTTNKLKSKIITPDYLNDVTDLDAIILMQSSGGIHSPPKYEYYEQFLCSIEGMI